MPEITIPLVGSYNQRQPLVLSQTTGDQADQRFINCFPAVSKNSITGAANFYIEKRPGLYSVGTVSAAQANRYVYKATGGQGYMLIVSGTAAVDTIVYYASQDLATKRSVGAIGTGVVTISEGYIGSSFYFFLTDSSGNGWILPEDSASDTTPTFTATTTSGSAVLTSVSSTTNVYVGQALSGTGIAAGARALSIDSATQITMTANATASNSGVTITFERIAKIIDADFPTNITGRFVASDGYLFIAESVNRRIYSSALNNPASWSASDYLTFGVASDIPRTLFPYKNLIGCLGKSSVEFFYNAGNPSGSVLSRNEQLTSRVGAGTVSVNPVAFLGDKIFFIGGESGQGAGIFVFDGFVPKKISSANFDKNIAGSAGFSLSAFSMNGLTWVFVSQNSNSKKNFFICLEYEIELEFSIASSNTDSIVFAGGSVGVSSINGNQGVWAVDTVNDDLFRFRNDIYQDDGATFTVTAQTKKSDLGTGNRKSYKTVWLMGSDIQSSGSATLEYSDDDYSTWTTAGTFDLTQVQPKIDRVGSHEGGRAWRLTHSANTAFRAQALKFDYTIGKH